MLTYNYKVYLIKFIVRKDINNKLNSGNKKNGTT